MAKYIDGFVLPVKKDKLAAYQEMAQKGGEIWKKHGALEYVESVGEDLDPRMEGMSFVRFSQLAKTEPDETVVFSFIVYKSRAHRDEVNAAVMKDPAMNDPAYKNMAMPFDPARMAYGGFEAIVDM